MCLLRSAGVREHCILSRAQLIAAETQKWHRPGRDDGGWRGDVESQLCRTQMRAIVTTLPPRHSGNSVFDTAAQEDRQP